jgi:tetratricopeptide (TPR) repeat protein
LSRESLAAFEKAAEQISQLGRDDTETGANLFDDWALALNQFGRVLEAERVYRRALEIQRRGQAEDTVAPVTLNNYARALQELGRFQEAAHYAELACAKAQKTDDRAAIISSLMLRAGIYRNLHDLTRASVMLAEVEPRLRRSLPSGHYGFASFASAQAMLALAKNDLPLAQRQADRSVEITEAAMKNGGEGSNFLPIFLVRRSTIELEARRSDQAVADARRALDLTQAVTQPGTYSLYVGRAYLALGRALQAQGGKDEAQAAFRSATEHLEHAVGTDNPETRAAQQLAESAPPRETPTRSQAK